MFQTCKCALPTWRFKSLVYVHYFTRCLGNVLCTVKAQFEQGNNSCDHSSSNADFGSFLHLPQKRHYASHIYIPCNICQTFINYKLMKCSTALWEHSNEHMEYYVNFDTSLLTLMSFASSRSIKQHYICAVTVTVWPAEGIDTQPGNKWPTDGERNKEELCMTWDLPHRIQMYLFIYLRISLFTLLKACKIKILYLK